MQIFDYGLLLFSIPLALYWVKQTELRRRTLALNLIVFGFFIHFIVSILRWQFAPWYGALMVIAGVEIVARLRVRPPSNRWRFVVVGLTILSILANAAFPIIAMPQASGPFLIGTNSQIIVNPNRIEEYGALRGQPRTFKVQYWYPAQTTDGFQQTKWIADGLVVPRALTRDWSLPVFVLDHITAYASNAYLNAPLSTQQSTYPVVIISHGWSSTRTLHTDLAEELASQGYFVVGMEHTYGSLATVLGDQVDIQYLYYDALPRRAVTPNYLEFANLLVETYATDIIAAIDTLEALNQAPGTLNQRLNLSSIQVIGHSTGGGAAVKAAIDDPRITSVLGMDAWVEPLNASDLRAGLSTRALYLRSNGWETVENNEYLYQLLQTSSNVSPLYQIDGTTHYDFAMVYMYSPLTRALGITGSLEYGYVNTMLDALVLEFLAAEDEYRIDTIQWPEVREIPIS